MWMPGDAARKAQLDRQIIGERIDAHPTGRKLTPAAREAAITHGVEAWKSRNIGNGAAAEAGIRQATKGVLKD